MKDSITYSVTKSFSKFPGGRKRDHGKFSGQQFREDVTVKLLDAYNEITFDLTGSAGYSTGFLDEAFGEIGKLIGLNDAKRRIKFISTDDPQAEQTCWCRIEEASKEANLP